MIEKFTVMKIKIHLILVIILGLHFTEMWIYSFSISGRDCFYMLCSQTALRRLLRKFWKKSLSAWLKKVFFEDGSIPLENCRNASIFKSLLMLQDNAWNTAIYK